MKVIGYLVDGLQIVGFRLENNKGAKKNASYESTLRFALLKKLDGVSCTKINGESFLVGINYQDLERLPIKDSISLHIDNGGVMDEENKIDDRLLWNLLADNTVRDTDYKIGLDMGNGGLKVLDDIDG
jgi:hypothetical protein